MAGRVADADLDQAASSHRVTPRATWTRRRLRRTGSGCIAVAAFALLCGCVGVDAFDDATLAPVRSGQQAVLMVRVAVHDTEGSPVAPFPAVLAEDNLRLAFGGFATGGAPDPSFLVPRFPTAEARAEGTAYATVPPGFYYLTFRPARRTDAFSDAAMLRGLPRWRIEVPPGVAVLYVGTFRISAQVEGLLFGGVVITAIDQAATVVLDDREGAVASLARDLPGVGPPVTRLAVRHEGPVLLGTPSR